MSGMTYKESVKTVWKTTGILSVVTIVEVVGALMYPEEWNRMPLNIFVVVMSLLKAWYIVGVFMHLKYEAENLIATVLFPMTFLVWAIIAFLWEGDWYLRAQEAGLFDWTTL